MFYEGLAVIVTAIGALMLLYALKLLVSTGWFMGWLRGMLGLSLVVSGVAMGAAAFDLLSFQQIEIKKTIATLSFEELAPQSYRAVLVDSQGREENFDLKEVEKLINLDQFIKFWIMESLLGFWDGYTNNQNNYCFRFIRKVTNKLKDLHSSH